MSLQRIRDLNLIFNSSDRGIVEWKSPHGDRYRYDRERCAVGPEIDSQNGLRRWEWHVLDKNDLTTAKRKVFELINENEF